VTTRRGFLWICGAAGAGVPIARKGFSQPAKPVMALQGAGTYSFCGKGRHELFGLVGLPGRPERVCDECLPCMLDIVEKDSPSSWPVRFPGASCMFCGRLPRQVRMMISGPYVFICDDCAHEAADFFAANGRRIV